MDDENLQGLVESEPVGVAGEVGAVQVGAEAGRPVLGSHADVAVGGLLGGFELLLAEHILDVEVARHVEKVALLRGHRIIFLL